MKTHAQDGFEILVSLLKGQHRYSNIIKEYKNPLDVRGFKFSQEKNKNTAFLGSEGLTASVGVFIDHIAYYLATEYANTISTPIKSLREVKFETDTPNQRMVFFVVNWSDGAECCVGGCTDFSGEGGWGRTEVYLFFEFLCELYDLSISQEIYSKEDYEHTVDLIQKAEQKRNKEMEW